MFVCPSKRPYACPSVRPPIFNKFELLLIHCYSTKNLRNYAFVCFFQGIFVVKYIILKMAQPLSLNLIIIVASLLT